MKKLKEIYLEEKKRKTTRASKKITVDPAPKPNWCSCGLWEWGSCECIPPGFSTFP